MERLSTQFKVRFRYKDEFTGPAQFKTALIELFMQGRAFYR